MVRTCLKNHIKPVTWAPHPLVHSPSLAARPNSLTIKLTQPGLPAWWRLVSPSLDWLKTFIKQLSWASLMLSTRCSYFCHSDTQVAFDFLPVRSRLITFTRGPMACKKQSRAQLMVSRRLVQLRLLNFGMSTRLYTLKDLTNFLKSLATEEKLWLANCVTPLVATTTKVGVYVSIKNFLLWY